MLIERSMTIYFVQEINDLDFSLFSKSKIYKIGQEN